MTNTKHILITLVVSAFVIAGLSILLASDPTPQSELSLKEDGSEIDGPRTPEEHAVTNPSIVDTMNPIAYIHTNKGDVELELFESDMPITVGNFVELAGSGFYNNVKFHRVIDGFMIQSGDPDSKGDNTELYGRGGPGYTIQDEFVEKNYLSNTRGTIAMANTGQPNSGGSQWFINLIDNTGLDFNKQPLTSKHPVFGRVINGMEVVDAIGGVATNERDVPTEPVVIESIEIVRGGTQ